MKLILNNFVKLGFTEEQAAEIVAALKTYKKLYSDDWRDALFGDFMRAYYPDVTERQGALLQRCRNCDEAHDYIMNL